jgi:hypothetical protein
MVATGIIIFKIGVYLKTEVEYQQQYLLVKKLFSG